MVSVGVDLGGTNIRAAVVEADGGIRTKARRPVGADHAPAAVVAAVAACIFDALGPAGVSLDEVAGVGVGVAGQVRVGTGVVAQGPNLGWQDVPFGSLMTAALGREVSVFNDVEAITWGETRHGSARGHRDVLAVFAGTGVGGGAVIDGRLHRGATGVAAEIGHVKVEARGASCGCGGKGCLEAYLGGRNLSRTLQEAAETDWPALLDAAGDARAVHAGHVEALLARGDPRAEALFGELGGQLGLVLANAVTLLNPSALVVGGTVLQGCPTLRRLAEEALRAHVLAVSWEALEILTATLGDDAGIVGAASLTLEEDA